MCMPDSTCVFRPSLSPSQIADLRLAASQMSGPTRRAVEAEMPLKYCGGTPLRAETLFGDAQAQQAPTCRTRVTDTRLTAQAALQALRAQGYREAPLPSPSPIAVVLKRMGFRWRQVVKAKPHKKLTETDASFDNSKKKMTKPCPQGASNAGALLAKRP